MPIDPSYRIVVYVRDVAEKPAIIRDRFRTRDAAITAAWDLAQRLQSTDSWLVPRDFDEDPFYARFVPFHAVDEIGVEEDPTVSLSKSGSAARIPA